MPAPLSAVVFHILLALADQKRHGYDIAGQVAEQSGGSVRPGPATLYGTLQRLLDRGWIAEVEAPAGGDEGRGFYRLPATGRQAGEAEIDRMEGLVRKARFAKAKQATSK